MERKPTNNIYGLMFRPSCMTTEDWERVMMSSDYSVGAGFYQEYRNHIAAMEIVAGCAKAYILKNWEKVEDWSGLDVVVEDNTGDPTEYYNYENSRLHKKKVLNPGVLDKVFSRLDERNKAKHNPIVSLTDVVLDPTDGDFSLTINGKDHLWISDDTVIIIADYIEKKLKDNGKETEEQLPSGEPQG